MQTAELKQASTSIDTTLPAGYLRLDFMPEVPQGPGDNQRIGNKIQSRNWQLKCWLRVETISGTETTALGYIRVYIVWPRKFSRQQAIANLNQANFPIYGMMDQDNWIVWYDKSFGMSNNPGITLKPGAQRIEFNKRFYATIEYPSGTETLGVKTPWIILSHNFDVTKYQVSWRGYAKCSYKDV